MSGSTPTTTATNTEPTTQQIDFLIVGAGPVGLLAANLIIQAGFSVRILDVEYEPNHWGRGDWIHGRTLELLERAGLAEELLSTGVKVDQIASYMNGELQSSIPFVPDEVESKHQYLLCVGQHITETSLQSSLTNQDVEVERPATVINIIDGPDANYPVRTTVMHLRDEARTEQVDCKYLLGCDGAHSDIRQQLGIQTEGETTETHAGVIDALVRTNFNAGRKDVCMLQNDVAKTISLFPRENGLTRIFVHFDENELEMRKEQYNRNKIQLEDIQREAKRALLPNRLEFLGILYWSVYVVGQRLATQMDAMRQRVFLCGDAAHCQSPTLGQGVNTGFGDVFNLVWKLCMVERGVIKRDILSTYTAERKPVAQQVLAVDKVAAKAAAGHQSSKEYCSIVQEHRAFTTGFGIQYRNSNSNSETNKNPLLLGSNNSKNQALVQTGMRAPNFKVFHYATGRKTRLFEKVHGDWLAFNMLVLADDLVKSHAAVESLLQWKHPALSTQIVITTTPADKIESEGILADMKDRIMLDKLNRAQVHAAYHSNNNEEDVQAVIVRPDGYIGAIAGGSTPDELVGAVKKYFDGFTA
ncbi:FAD binding domain-containing protein [Zychaea mexicana]|uniref:FAD binding domain-containing protein n=1 Tax=Zychaea mexicana TaxID=64656 RepID=UPI0022FEE1FD|nr:FAD binding domain-containing protein [Zychaea mexicana]KAI9490299.1 FAD binding domain-containing protein [Zychaea mexicana]